MKKKNSPVECPSCESSLLASELSCSNCNTVISRSYSLPILLQLSPDDQDFIFEFFILSGSLKDIAIKIGKSLFYREK